MNRRSIASGLLLALLFGSPVKALVVAYEGFDYPNSSGLLHNRAGGFGWTEGWMDNDQDFNGTMTADDTSLTSPAFPFTPVGDRIATVGGGEANRRMGANYDMTEDGVTFYGSFLLRKSVDGGTSGDAVELRLISNLTTTAAFRFGIGSGETLFMDSGANATTGAETLNIGDTQFMVFKIVSSSVGDDQFFGSIYTPTDTVPVAEPSEWDVTLSEAVDHVFNGVRMHTNASVAGAEYDEIRIGDAWEDVTSSTSFVSGDFNGSGAIDPGDLTALVEGLYVGNSFAEGDIDFNGVVDLTDYNIFRDIYLGAGLQLPSSLPVPEPTALIGCLACCATLAFRRPQR